MKITRADVQKWTEERGLEPVQIDGIPEGFSFKEPDIKIGDTLHEGDYVAYVPLSQWLAAYAPSIDQLQARYKAYGIKGNN